jgi:hypothetical protein
MRGSKGQRIVSRIVLLATGLVATTGAVTAETGKTARIAGDDSKGFDNPSKAAVVGSKTLTGSWLVAGSVSVFKLVGSEGPDDESSKFGVGERRRFLVFFGNALRRRGAKIIWRRFCRAQNAGGLSLVL